MADDTPSASSLTIAEKSGNNDPHQFAKPYDEENKSLSALPAPTTDTPVDESRYLSGSKLALVFS
jgi:hypothetical protein